MKLTLLTIKIKKFNYKFLKNVFFADTWGGDITTAAILHLAHTAPPKLQFTATDFNR
jgi:hypothetical protein